MSEPSMQKLVVDSLKEIEQISVKNATEESVPTVEIITINDPSVTISHRTFRLTSLPSLVRSPSFHVRR